MTGGECRKNSLKFSKRSQNRPVNRKAKDFNRRFTVGTRISDKLTERHETSLVLKEMQIKSQCPKLTRLSIPDVGEDVGQLNPTLMVGL